MEEVLFDNMKYVKASVIAKEFRYTSDYIGQLCRAKKVDARLIGRSWFVNPDSLITHKKGKYSKLISMKQEESVNLKVSDKAIETKTSRQRVEPVIKNKTMKALYHSALKIAELNDDGRRNLRVSYERDEEVLFPEIIINKTRPPKFIKIEPAGAIKLKVSGKKKQTSFEADELPEVSLSGMLTVAGLEEASESVEDAEKKLIEKPVIAPQDKKPLKNIAKTKVMVSKNLLDIKPAKKLVKVQVVRSTSLNNPISTSEIKPLLERTNEVNEIKALFKVPVPSKATAEESSAAIAANKTVSKQTDDVKFAPTAPEAMQPAGISPAVLASPLIATVIALACVTVLFSASSNVVVSALEYKSETIFQLGNLLSLLQ
jgi:hypothetical protein